jgi:serine/threonine-protein kinase
MTNAMQQHPSTPDVGTTLGGRFRVVRHIGEGGMGVVLECENTLTGKRVAVKWMHPQMAAQADAAERMVREARASARVRHPNVVDVYDVVQEENAIFLVMELLEGEPLSAMLERGQTAPHAVIQHLIDAMRGVAAAHRGGVIHRDIKPDNIFLATEPDRSKPIPKVLDFGISKLADRDGLSLTRTGMTLGTPLYMSYEQLAGVRDIDGRTDVYAFGVILYEALTGQPPYDAQTFSELIIKITTTEPTAPKVVRPNLPGSLSALVQKAMARDREQRTPTLDALITELEPYASYEGFQSRLTGADAQIFSSAATMQAPTPISVPVRVSMDPAPRASAAGKSVSSGAAAVASTGAASTSGERAIEPSVSATSTSTSTSASQPRHTGGAAAAQPSELGMTGPFATGEGVLTNDDEVRPSSIPRTGGRGLLFGGLALLVIAGAVAWMLRGGGASESANGPHVVTPETTQPSNEPATPEPSEKPELTPPSATPPSATPPSATATPTPASTPSGKPSDEPQPKPPRDGTSKPAAQTIHPGAAKPPRTPRPSAPTVEPEPAPLPRPRPQPTTPGTPTPRAGRPNADDF